MLRGLTSEVPNMGREKVTVVVKLESTANVAPAKSLANDGHERQSGTVTVASEKIALVKKLIE